MGRSRKEVDSPEGVGIFDQKSKVARKERIQRRGHREYGDQREDRAGA